MRIARSMRTAGPELQLDDGAPAAVSAMLCP